MITQAVKNKKDLSRLIDRTEEIIKKLNADAKMKYCIKLTCEYSDNAPDFYMDAENFKKEYLSCHKKE